ncbi:hypothetical protein ACFSM5_21090 [Lacibacterium aquatile]|uniref:Uncharacterized protein n=1 Tax=Lacibacterium aquatile TaxID=1168082 RepID=A0ABW5DWE1_9PROT
MTTQITVVPFNFGAALPNDPVEIQKTNIALIHQTTRDDDIYDKVYRAKLLTRIVKSGLEVLVDESTSDIVDRWEDSPNLPALKIARFTRKPFNMPGDETLVAVRISAVSDVLPVAPIEYPDYKTLIIMGGLRVPVTETPDEVKRLLGW